VEPFIQDLAKRFEGDGLEDIIGPVFQALSNLVRSDKTGLGGVGTGETGGWRAAIAGIDALCAVKPVAAAVRPCSPLHFNLLPRVVFYR